MNRSHGPKPAISSTQPAASPTQLLLEREVAEMLGVGRNTLARWRMRRTGPPYLKLAGSIVRYRLGDVNEWLNVAGA